MLVQKTTDVTVYHKNRSFIVKDINKTQLLSRTVIDCFDEGKEDWVVLKDFYVWSHRVQQVIKIHRWSVTDLASIPKPFRVFIAVNEEHRYAAIVHDTLYKMDYGFDRRTVDLIFMDLCEAQGVSKAKTNVMYLGVRSGGWAYFQKPNRPNFVPEELKEKYRQAHPELIVDSVYK